MDDGRENEKRWPPGAIAMLIVIPLTLAAFAIDAVVLIRGENADEAARAKAAAAHAATPDAAPSTSAP